ncbi:Uncharacterized protein TPAR_07839 [Tolypocladium paradoxum]|uniref:Uncharacterized protein n=1 Tax=Tolypocladium paradoxum TaxID=94208 RepID=A0A2S4KP40_9HYPO|nr:Uncharacterized protein TPAR_07839 [Tolypocladium paradoxum]
MQPTVRRRAVKVPRGQFKGPRKHILDQAVRHLRANDDTMLQGEPCCSKAAFEHPRLRKCPYALSTVDWGKAVRLGGGLDGYVWKVHFGTNGPYALKVFYDAEPPDIMHYYAFQRECQNAALVQMIGAAVQRATTTEPIVIKSTPTTNDDARANLLAFSDEQRQRRQSQRTVIDKGDMIVSTVPPLTQCFGWLEFDGQDFRKMPYQVRPPTTKVDKLIRGFSSDRNYFGIVFEYVADEQNNQGLVEEVDWFLYRAGFSHTLSPDRRNWCGSKVVDHSEYVHPEGFGWSSNLYGPRLSEQILV